MRERQELFPLGPIVINIFAIGVLIGIYRIVIVGGMLPDYQTYIYWTINVLISYNILVASARSFLAPILTIIVGSAALIGYYHFNITLLTLAQSWQIFALGIVGFFIACTLKL